VPVPELGVDAALEAALAALRRRDYSVRQLEERLRARGLPEEAREGAVESLLRTGLLDDRRFAEVRASALAERGAGDALVRHELASAGIDAEIVEDAVSLLEPEPERAARIVARRGPGARTARYLAAKGYADDVARAVAGRSGDELG
jgi:SOS response regulatory protein OraA/RecX